MAKRVKVIEESDTGRNLKFYDNYHKKSMTRKQFVQQIEKGNYPNYHIRKINNIDTPVSNPDETVNNNLG